jgi:hypothetical protein
MIEKTINITEAKKHFSELWARRLLAKSIFLSKGN